jgi:hypothetical protein
MCLCYSENLKSFDKIPGPGGLPGIGSLLSYATFRPKAHQVWSEWAAKYGPIYKCAASLSPWQTCMHAPVPMHAARSIAHQLANPATHRTVSLENCLFRYTVLGRTFVVVSNPAVLPGVLESDAFEKSPLAGASGLSKEAHAGLASAFGTEGAK